MNEHEHNLGPADEPIGPVDEQLEAKLAGLTEWTGSTEGPLARAMTEAGVDPAPGVLARIGGVAASLRGFSRGQAAALLALGAVGVVAVGVLGGMPNAEKIRRGMDLAYVPEAEKSVHAPPPPPLATFHRYYDVDSDGVPARESEYAFGASTDGKPGSQLGRQRFGEDGDYMLLKHSSPEQIAKTVTQVAESRQIIRRGQVEIVAADVQVAFRKAQDLIKVERGEFVQESVLSGAGQAMTGRVVIRIEPGRLAEAMQASRGLGELAAEQAGGDDVTDRLTDLEAQIRNEQRVEKEMLELFDLRKDAPLKDVLELREQLARVRGNIERMQAQQSQIGRLVSLATLTITIRPKPDAAIAPPPVDEKPSFFALVGKNVSHGWDRATTNLASFAGWSVEKAVGELPMWTTLAVIGVVAWRVVRKKKASPSSTVPRPSGSGPEKTSGKE